MAPSPEYDKEPKAPDKSDTNSTSDDSKVIQNFVNDQQTNLEHKPTNTTSNVDVENNKHVEALDDGQLRALLDEAITYKCPKDREGKSNLFKELLEEVEQDEQECEEAARSLSGGVRGGRRGARGRRALPHSNSLQDLVAALAADAPPRRHHVRHPHPQPTPSNVSARAIHGGSLPSGVNTSSLLSDEPARGAGYLATVRCVNPPPLAERRVSASDANAPPDLDVNRRSKPMFPMTYTARATLEIGSGSVSSGRAVTTTTASNQVDSAIPFSCITTPEVVSSCNTTSSTSQAAIAVDPKPLQLASSYRAVASLTGAPPRAASPDASASAPAPALASASASAPLDAQRAHPLQPRNVISSTFNGLPLSRPNYGSTGTSASDEFKKSLDENGNSVQGFSSPLSGSSQHKKPRRKKSSKNETVIDCRQIDGYQGDKDVNELLRFIESNEDHGRTHKLGRAKHKDDGEEKSSKKRPSERRKDKENKMKRATSMEELSRTTIEELTETAPALRGDKKERRDHNAKAERRSWGEDAREPFYYAEPPEPPATELTEFQTVTKKRKPRRRADDADREVASRRARQPSPRARRESAPPSDRSNDSNDDMDSVHSLPADAPPAARDGPAQQTPRTVPSVPHASYAEIARTRHNIPDLIESCNYYGEGEGGGEPRRGPGQPPPLPNDTDGYPALETRPTTGGAPHEMGETTDTTEVGEAVEVGVVRRPREGKGAAGGRRERKERAPGGGASGGGAGGVGGEGTAPPPPPAPAPDVVADRRPPVILLDSAARPRDMDGVTFGFDINEQLLGGGARRPRCDLVRDAIEAPAAGVPVRAGCAALRFLPPQPPPNTHHLHQIIDYVGGAWEDIVRCTNGKVRYYSE